MTSRRSSAEYSEIDDEVLGARVVDTGTLMLSRAILSGIAIAMLWMSSLRVITSMLQVTNALPIPPVEVVVHSVESLINESIRLRGEYMTCVRDELATCNATLVLRQENEAQRSADARAANQAHRDESKLTQGACAVAHVTALSSIATWQEQQSGIASASNGTYAYSPSAHYLPSCPNSTRDNLDALTGDTAALRSASLLVAKGYSADSQSTVGLLADQIDARASYDRQYIENKTGLRDAELVQINGFSVNHELQLRSRLSAIDMSALVACSTLPTPATCPNGASAYALAQAAQDKLRLQYEAAARTYADTVARAADYVASASNKLNNAGNTIASIVSTLNRDFPEVGGFAGITGVSVPDTNLFPESFNPTLAGIDMPFSPSPAEILAGVSQAAAAFRGQLDSAIEFANGDASKLVANLAGIGVSGFEDYNPPTIDAWREREKHKKRSEEFEQEAAVSIDALDEAAKREANDTQDAYQPLFSSNISASRLRGGERDTSWFSYRGLSDAGFQFDWLLNPLLLMSNLVQALDVVWRVLQTINILRKFWGKSALAVQPIDMSTDRESKSRTRKAMNPVMAMARLVTHPLTIASIFLTFGFVVGGTAYTVYQPVFATYTRDCIAKIDGKPVGDGTVLTRNAYAIAFNFASHEGNRMRLDGLDAYEIRRTEACTRYGEKSANDERKVQSDMYVIVGSHTKTTRDVAVMNSCYNLPYLDAAFRAAPVYDRDNQTYPVPSVPLSSPACVKRLDNTSLEDGIFDCSVMPDCQMPCDDLADEHGNDQSDLYAFARTAMCTAQWWFHSTVLRFCFSIIIWIFINLFRISFLAGAIRLSWQFLNTGFFSYVATCNANGVGTHSDEALKAKTAGLLRWMRVKGALYIAFAILMQVPWCVAIIYFSQGLVFDVLT